MKKLKAGKALLMLTAPVILIVFTLSETRISGRWIGAAISSEQPGRVTEETLLEITPPEKSNSPPLTVGTGSI